MFATYPGWLLNTGSAAASPPHDMAMAAVTIIAIAMVAALALACGHWRGANA